MPSSPCVIFVDTNIYLHYTFFSDVPWTDLLSVSEVALVVPPITVSEIGKHKYTNQSRRLRERAGQVSKRFAELLESGDIVRPGVQIMFVPIEPEEFESHHLSRESQDDHLLASILQYSVDNPTVEVLLVTNDMGLKVKSKFHKIRAVDLPDEYRRVIEIDPNEKRARELDQRLRELRSLAPKLKLQFESGSNRFEVARISSRITDSISEGMNKMKAIYPRIQLLNPDSSDQEGRGLTNAFDLAELFPQEWAPSARAIEEYNRAIQEYNDELETFYEDYELYLPKRAQVDELLSRTIKLNVQVTNEGTAPAQDVRVFVKLPDSFNVTINDQVFSPPKEPKAPKAPKRPEPPRSPAFNMFESRRRLDVANNRLPSKWPHFIEPAQVCWRGLTRDKDLWVISFEVGKLNHGYSENCPNPVYVVFPCVSHMHSFKIEYEITAANIPARSDGVLHIVVKDDPET